MSTPSTASDADPGIHATNYNFCEMLPVSIAGHVGIDSDVDDGGCERHQPANRRRHDSTARLAPARCIATTTTDANGNYLFDDLRAGHVWRPRNPAGRLLRGR